MSRIAPEMPEKLATSRSLHRTMNKELYSRVVELSKVINLDTIFFREFNAKGLWLGMAPREATVDCSVGAHGRVTSTTTFEVMADFSVDTKGADDAGVAEIRGQLCLKYSVPQGTDLAPEIVEAFASTNGVYHAWPYWREFVQGASGRLAIPPLMLPPVRLSELIAQAGKPKRSEVKQRRNAG